MQFSRAGNFLRLSRITGPTHNLLGLHLSKDHDPRPLEVIDLAEGAAEKRLTPEEVKRFVLEGVEEANRALGTSLRVVGIEFLSNDTPPARVYGALAKRIAEQFAAPRTI